jgi:diaminopimelate decarboxylase
MLSPEKIIEIAGKEQTPMYLFDLDVLEGRVKEMQQILGDDVALCYAMKANPFLVDAMKALVPKLEVCSPGEFAICERENASMESIVLSGVNKEEADICHVMKDCGGVGIYTVESLSQLKLLQKCASAYNQQICVLVRVTSGNQFGVDEELLEQIIKERDTYTNVTFKGIQCYTGTQKKKMQQIEDELVWLDALCDRLYDSYGWKAEELEYGPGLMVSYFGEDAFDDGMEALKEFAKLLKPLRAKYKLTFEMGRFIAASCGMFISSVVDTKCNKGQNYCIIDGGINHINYYGQTMAMKVPAYTYVKSDTKKMTGFDFAAKRMFESESDEKWTICGSLCTVGDVIVKNLPITSPKPGDKIIFYNIGAYSVTEGIYLFLSRRLPKIAAYSEKKGVQVYRDVTASDRINSRRQVLTL